MIVTLSTYHVKCDLCHKGTGTVSRSEADALIEAGKRNWQVRRGALKGQWRKTSGEIVDTLPIDEHLCPDCIAKEAERRRLALASESQACVCSIHATCPLHPIS